MEVTTPQHLAVCINTKLCLKTLSACELNLNLYILKNIYFFLFSFAMLLPPFRYHDFYTFWQKFENILKSETTSFLHAKIGFHYTHEYSDNLPAMWWDVNEKLISQEYIYHHLSFCLLVCVLLYYFLFIYCFLFIYLLFPLYLFIFYLSFNNSSAM